MSFRQFLDKLEKQQQQQKRQRDQDNEEPSELYYLQQSLHVEGCSPQLVQDFKQCTLQLKLVAP
jgi:hypothetical protein